MSFTTNGPTGLQLEILELLRMDAETLESLTDMLSGEEKRVASDTVRVHLRELSSRNLVRRFRALYADESSEEAVETDWREITDKGLAVVQSR